MVLEHIHGRVVVGEEEPLGRLGRLGAELLRVAREVAAHGDPLAHEPPGALAEAAAREASRVQEESAAPAGSAGSEATVVPSAAKPARYQIVGELGRGGMGIVYQAQDTVLDRPVAFKVLPDALRENPQALANFLREAKSAAKLNHPNIVHVIDRGLDRKRYFFVMDYVDGTDFKIILSRKLAHKIRGWSPLLLNRV